MCVCVSVCLCVCVCVYVCVCGGVSVASLNLGTFYFEHCECRMYICVTEVPGVFDVFAYYSMVV